MLHRSESNNFTRSHNWWSSYSMFRICCY